MVFPVVATVTTGSDLPEHTSHNITMPACAVGDVIIVWAGVSNQFSGGPSSLPGFDTVANLSEGGGFDYVYCGRRVVTGSEPWYNGGAGGSIAFAHQGPTGADCAYAILRVTGADPGAFSALTFPNDFARTAVANANPDPPNLAPAWAAGDTLWLAGYIQHDGSASTLAYPAGYTALASLGIGTSFIGTHIGIARRSINAASENPGAFTTDTGGNGWVALTMGMRAPLVAAQPIGATRSGPLRRFRRY